MESAIGFLELSSIAKGIESIDALLKMAQVDLLYAQAVPRGKYLILINGKLGELEQSMQAGKETAGPALLDSFIIPNVDSQVLPAFQGKIVLPEIEAVGVIETKDVARALLAADVAVKKAAITLIEIFHGRGAGGKGFVTFTGEVGAVRTAVNAGVSSIQPKDALISSIVLPYAHKGLLPVLTGKEAAR